MIHQSVGMTPMMLHTTFQQNKDCNTAMWLICSRGTLSSCIRPSSKTRTATQILAILFHCTIICCIRPSSKTRTATDVDVLVICEIDRVAYDLPAKQGLQQEGSKFYPDRPLRCIRPSSKTRTATSRCKPPPSAHQPGTLHTTFQQNKDCNASRSPRSDNTR